MNEDTPAASDTTQLLAPPSDGGKDASEELQARRAAMAVAVASVEWNRGNGRSVAYWIGCFTGVSVSVVSASVCLLNQRHPFAPAFVVAALVGVVAGTALVLSRVKMQPRHRHPSQVAVWLTGTLDAAFNLFNFFVVGFILSDPALLNSHWLKELLINAGSIVLNSVGYILLLKTAHSVWFMRRSNPCEEVRLIVAAMDAHTGSPRAHRIALLAAHEFYFAAFLGIIINAATLLGLCKLMKAPIEEAAYIPVFVLSCSALLCLASAIYCLRKRNDPSRVEARENISAFAGFYSHNKKQRDLSILFVSKGLLTGMVLSSLAMPVFALLQHGCVALGLLATLPTILILLL
ncbi:hypothetical protein BC830DRAFT_1165076, partial [Chytriomyces sp. MP71]